MSVIDSTIFLTIISESIDLSDIGDNLILVILWRWKKPVDDFIHYVVDFYRFKLRSWTSKIAHRNLILVNNISNCSSSSQTFRQHILYPNFVTNIDVAESDLVQHKRPVAWWPFGWHWYYILYGWMANFILAIIEFEGWVEVNLSPMTIFHMNSTSQIQVIR